MSTHPPLYLDATMLYRWRELAPVGVVRLERLLASHLRFRSSLGTAEYVLWDGGYRPADQYEAEVLDRLLSSPVSVPRDDMVTPPTIGTPQVAPRRLLGKVRRAGLRSIDRVPENLRPFAEQAAWSTATLFVESSRHLRRSRAARAAARRRGPSPLGGVSHRVSFEQGGDLVALGLGWEYIDHEAMYALKRDHGVRIHMPAFDLIPVAAPHLNAGQSHLVHRYYAEMAHYADSITSISVATADALRAFYSDEGLPTPSVEVNPLPGLADITRPDAPPSDQRLRRHRLEGEEFILSVSTVEIRKNHLMLAKVWAEAAREGVLLPRLLIVGRIGWDVDELLRWVAHAPELTDRVTIASDVEDAELIALYKDALFTLFPSRMEGWGLPITESMMHGKVCVHSTDPAQAEASQGLMPAIHADDFLSWKREITALVAQPDRRLALEATIRDRYAPRTTDQYCDRFEEILGRRRGCAA